ncbi:ABC-2 type transport system ATP-binding protein [Eubacterium ruminantium]|jgi:ABC-2 type transport system ATP-binding protein|uniref:ABC-2 type transport system ATP-binding protein n=1 Tax=Eubacterium ruminantium TaxID=42322 RepID=A0A1T4KIG9_9FIRM|nr:MULTISPECIES: ABC transporter ATP-binding protein [Eubacterium]MCR5367090.1 ABC transporter ATP-binding protein [Eubacterium sp.]SCW32275.1 ABC-2 type transport system ATP-binding protein [Eubacterium ruminantium]SDM27630.1 ABC-2 type transport system ATP-binding protein [Eubacterium ruminantium]SJZ42147.1 ABC-2 type transport system ATP-binding protein [Eubacterium ruminantium]
MLKISGLKKSFGDKEVIKGLDMHIPSHSIFGLAGRNGAGKTTVMKMILGLIKADEGEIYVGDEKVVFGNTPTNRFVGYLPDVPEFYSFMNAREYLRFCGEITGLPKNEIKDRSEELLEKVGLAEEKHRIKGYSRGMKQRLGIAQALLGRPKLLICDEPTSALDPVGRKDVLDILSSVKDETSVIFSTHILTDVERICTDIAFLSDGVIKLSGKTDEIRDRYRSEELYIEYDAISDKVKEKLLKKFNDAVSGEDINNNMKFDMSKGEYAELIYFIADNNIMIHKMERIEPSFEDIFLEVTGE